MEKYEEIDIRRILEIMFSKKLLIILILLLSITLGYAYSYYYKKPQYKSSVTILLVADESKKEKELTQTDLSINSALISTYSNIAKSTNVINKTIENLNLNITTQELQNNVEAIQVDKTQFLKITVKNGNPEVAKVIANELSEVFIKEIKNIYNLANINIIDKAETESTPFNINHSKDMIMFVFGGLFISLAIVMIIYFFDDTIKNENDIERNLKIKNLGTLPFDSKKEKLIIESNPKSHIVESIKILRTNILYSTSKKSILITSCKENEGKSWVSNNLAVALAQANKKVILLDANLRKSNNQSEIFNIDKGEGLSDFIREISNDQFENLEASRKFIKETNVPNLHILQNGTVPPNPSELISSNNMRKLIELLKNMYDIVLLDGPSCMTISDSIALSSMLDSTIVVVESNKTKINSLKKIKKSIEDVNGHISGTIINKAELQKGKYYGKRYGYYYGKEGQDITKTSKEQEIIHLEDIIELAKINIKSSIEDDELEENKIDEITQIQEKQDTNSNIDSKKIVNEVKNVRKDISNELKNVKDYLTDIKNIDFNNKKLNGEIKDLKEIQNDRNEELLNKIDSIKNVDYSDEFKTINENIQNIKQKDYSEDFESINESIKNIQNKDYSKEFEDISDRINNIKIEDRDYSEELKNINESINDIKKSDYSEEFENINYTMSRFMEEIENLNNEIKELKEVQEHNNLQILEKVQNMNYEKEFAKMNEKIENIKLISQVEEEKQADKSEEIIEEENNNIISFEVLKERRKANNRVFDINEDISYEDLERLSPQIFDMSNIYDIATSN